MPMDWEEQAKRLAKLLEAEQNNHLATSKKLYEAEERLRKQAKAEYDDGLLRHRASLGTNLKHFLHDLGLTVYGKDMAGVLVWRWNWRDQASSNAAFETGHEALLDALQTILGPYEVPIKTWQPIAPDMRYD